MTTVKIKAKLAPTPNTVCIQLVREWASRGCRELIKIAESGMIKNRAVVRFFPRLTNTAEIVMIITPIVVVVVVILVLSQSI